MFVCVFEFTTLIWFTSCLLHLSQLRLGTLPGPPQNFTKCTYSSDSKPTKNFIYIGVLASPEECGRSVTVILTVHHFPYHKI